MEDGLYFIAQHVITTVGTLIQFGLERKLNPEKKRSFREAKKEYQEQMELYRSGERDLKPSLGEIYEKYQEQL